MINPESTKKIKFYLLTIITTTIIFNPYTIIGKPGFLLAFILTIIAITDNKTLNYLKSIIFPIAGLIAIAFIGVISSILHRIDQLVHLWTVFSFTLTILSSIGLLILYRRNNFDFNDLCFSIFISITINSAIVVVEMLSPEIRSIIESILIEAGNQSYEDGFKFRGIASAGGANLSLTTPLGITLALHLLNLRRINAIIATTSILAFIFAGTLIGRTGLLLTPIPFITYLLYNMRSILNIKSIIKLVLILILLTISTPIILAFISDFFTDLFGEGFAEYSFKFLLEGSKGLENEGTTSTISQFLQVLPYNFPEILVGYGFYGEGYFFPWTDSGYARTFLSVGYPFGIVFYILIIYILLKDKNFLSYPIASLLFLLIIAETKEPFLISGYAARALIIMSTFLSLQNLKLVPNKLVR